MQTRGSAISGILTEEKLQVTKRVGQVSWRVLAVGDLHLDHELALIMVCVQTSKKTRQVDLAISEGHRLTADLVLDVHERDAPFELLVGPLPADADRMEVTHLEQGLQPIVGDAIEHLANIL